MDMPEISRFLGIVISLHFDDHNPPHIHAEYNEYAALVSINDLSLLRGDIPPRAVGFVIEWMQLHQEELLKNWNMVQDTGKSFKIEPLT